MTPNNLTAEDLSFLAKQEAKEHASTLFGEANQRLDRLDAFAAAAQPLLAGFEQRLAAAPLAQLASEPVDNALLHQLKEQNVQLNAQIKALTDQSQSLSSKFHDLMEAQIKALTENFRAQIEAQNTKLHAQSELNAKLEAQIQSLSSNFHALIEAQNTKLESLSNNFPSVIEAQVSSQSEEIKMLTERFDKQKATLDEKIIDAQNEQINVHAQELQKNTEEIARIKVFLQKTFSAASEATAAI